MGCTLGGLATDDADKGVVEAGALDRQAGDAGPCVDQPGQQRLDPLGGHLEAPAIGIGRRVGGEQRGDRGIGAARAVADAFGQRRACVVDGALELAGAVGDDGEPVAEAFGVRHDVRREQDGGAAIALGEDQRLELFLIDGVKARKGFVEDEEVGAVDDAAEQLDEPFSGLDPVNQEKLEALILAERDRGATILFSTHIMAHAERLCDRLAIIAGGTRQFEGTVDDARATLPERVRYRPRRPDPSVAALLPADATPDADGWRFEMPAEGIEPLLTRLIDAGPGIAGLSIERPGLHDAFVRIVGRQAAEGAPQDIKPAESGA